MNEDTNKSNNDVRPSGIVVGPDVPDDFATFCDGFAVEFLGQAGGAASESSTGVERVCVSVAPMVSNGCVVFFIPAPALAAFFNRFGEASKALNFADVQFWLQNRLTKRRDPGVEVYGAAIDYDLPVDDVLAVIASSDVSNPTAAWKTQGGAKFCYLFDHPVKEEEFEIAAMHLATSFDGVDPGSWEVTHGQHLPTAWKTVGGDVRGIQFPATQLNNVPLNIGELTQALPPRVHRLLGGKRALSRAERTRVDEYLSERGIPAPEQCGESLRYERCPTVDHRDAKCCEVSRRLSGAVQINCYAGHGGGGRKTWSESEIFSLATGENSSDDGYDIIGDVPATWAGYRFVEHKAKAAFKEPLAADQVKANIRLWENAKAHADAKRLERWADREKATLADPPTISDWESLYRSRVSGRWSARVYFDDASRHLRLIAPNADSVAVSARGATLSVTANRHEWRASLGYTYVLEKAPAEEDKSRLIAKRDCNRAFDSNWNKAMGGHPEHLAALGVPRIRQLAFPAAFVHESWRIEPNSKQIVAVIPAPATAGDAGFDALPYFTQLWRAGRLPLATENDVRLLLMAIASPLLREVAAGQLGLYWFIGPPGAGKDFLCEIVADIYRRAAGTTGKAKFDLNLTDDLELKRSFAAAGSAVFARAKEAGKRAGMAELLIRVAGTDQISARGLYKDEVEIPMTFTILADSAEDPPERREISRRAVMLTVAPVDASVSLGAVRNEILGHAAAIVANLMSVIEIKPVEWYLDRTNAGSRPLIPAALADLFGATLAEVRGRDLQELFDGLLFYTSTLSADEGDSQRKKARERDGKEATVFPSYRLSHAIDALREHAGFKAVFGEFKTRRQVEMWLERETNYLDVKQGKRPYLRIEIDGTWFAFKLVRDKRNFVLVPELKFCDAMGLEPAASGPVQNPTISNTELGASPRQPPTGEGESDPNEPMRFSVDDLVTRPRQRAAGEKE